MSSSTPAFPKLSPTNYNLWSGDMEAWLRAQGLWRIVAGLSPRPTTPASPGDTSTSTVDTATLTLQEAWDAKSDKAAGGSGSCLSRTRRHLDSPATMWKTLHSTYMQQKAGSRFCQKWAVN